MKGITTLALALAASASIQAFEVGDQVLAKCGFNKVRGEIIEISERGNAYVNFDEEAYQFSCGDNFYELEDKEKISKYLPIGEYEIVEQTRGGLFQGFRDIETIIETVRVEERVRASCGRNLEPGIIEDLTIDGYYKVKFDDHIHNSVCGMSYLNLEYDLKKERLELF
jgi:hypothetical protein